jgi:hypothetical protein
MAWLARAAALVQPKPTGVNYLQAGLCRILPSTRLRPDNGIEIRPEVVNPLAARKKGPAQTPVNRVGQHEQDAGAG